MTICRMCGTTVQDTEDDSESDCISRMLGAKHKHETIINYLDLISRINKTSYFIQYTTEYVSYNEDY